MPTIAQSASNNIVAEDESYWYWYEPSNPPANPPPFISIGTTELIDDGTKARRPTLRSRLRNRRSSSLSLIDDGTNARRSTLSRRSSSLSLTSIGENEELCVSDVVDDDDDEEETVVSSATSEADICTKGSSGRFALSPSIHVVGRRKSTTSNIIKSTSTPFLRRHSSSSSIVDISSGSSVSTISSTTNRDMNKKNFVARRREIDKVGPVTRLSSRKFERRLSELEDFIKVEERAFRFNELMKKKESTRRNSLSLDDSNDQRTDTAALDSCKRGIPHVSSSPSIPEQPQDKKDIPTRTPTRRLSMTISITESDDNDNVLAELEGVGMLNIQTAGVGLSSICHNRRASM